MGAPAARQFTASQRLFVRAHVAREDLGGNRNVVVSVVDPLDFLVPLGALTRDDHGVAGLGCQDRASYRVAAAGRHLGDVFHARTHGCDAAQQVVADFLRVFGARVLVRHPQHVGFTRGDLREVLTLGGIAIAVRPEDDDDAAGGQLAGRAQCPFEGFGRMRVVDDDERLTAGRGVDLLHASRDLGSILDRRDHIREVDAETHCADDRDGGVLDIDLTQDRHGNTMAGAAGINQGEHGASDRLIGGHVADLPVGGLLGQRGHRRDRYGRLLSEAAPPFVVDADDAVAGMLGGEQECLRLEVVLHVAVIVEVVVLQVRERGNVEDDAVDAVQGKRVRRQFDNACAALVLLGGRQETCDDGSLGGRAHGLERNWADVRFHGAAQRCVRESRRDRGAHQVRGRRLPVRASHGHRREAGGGGCVDVRAQLRNDGARVGHLDDGRSQAAFEGLDPALLVGENDTRPGLDRRVRETDAVLLQTRDCDEQPLVLAVVGRHGDAAQAEGGVGNLGKRTVGTVEPLDVQAFEGGRQRDRRDRGTNINH